MKLVRSLLERGYRFFLYFELMGPFLGKETLIYSLKVDS